MQAIRSENLGLGPNLLAGVRIGCGELELIDDRPVVQAGPADQQHPMPAPIDVLRHGPRELLVPSHRERLLGLGDVH
jgi:hypothetical protein